MIKNIVFDFGDVFINLDKEVVSREMKKNGHEEPTSNLYNLNEQFEIGAISSEEFIDGLQFIFPKVEAKEITAIWNNMLLDFPDYRLSFLEKLAQKNSHRLFLLSNTNALHIPHVAMKMGNDKFNRFKNCFEQFYLSHEINLRKPNAEIFEFVLEQNNLNAEETFFIDDTKENTDAAEVLGIKTWNLIVGTEDIIDLENKLKNA